MYRYVKLSVRGPKEAAEIDELAAELLADLVDGRR